MLILDENQFVSFLNQNPINKRSRILTLHLHNISYYYLHEPPFIAYRMNSRTFKVQSHLNFIIDCLKNH